MSFTVKLEDEVIKNETIEDAEGGSYFVDDEGSLFQVDTEECGLCWEFEEARLVEKSVITGYTRVEADIVATIKGLK